MKFVVGLAGRMGSGKTVVSDYLCRKYGAKQMRFSQILVDVLKRLHLPPTRENLQKLGHVLRVSVGETVVVDAFREDLKAIDSDVVVIDGVRYHNEVDLVKSFPRNILVYLDASPRLRYERCVSRGEKGEKNISFEDFVAAEQRETERYLDEIKAAADYVIVNEGTLEELYRRVDEIMEENRGHLN